MSTLEGIVHLVEAIQRLMVGLATNLVRDARYSVEG
jgi:hypothetical protein